MSPGHIYTQTLSGQPCAPSTMRCESRCSALCERLGPAVTPPDLTRSIVMSFRVVGVTPHTYTHTERERECVCVCVYVQTKAKTFDLADEYLWLMNGLLLFMYSATLWPP